MATTPFSADVVTALEGATHSGKLRAVQGPAVTPAFYCCISGNTVGVDKDPVPVIEMSALQVCPAEAITLDYSLSWSPTDTLATWAVDWGDGQNSNGVWPGAGSIAHPLGGYVLAGKYDVVLTLTDTLGAVGTAQVQVFVLACDDADAMDEGDVFPDERWANWEELKGIAAAHEYVWENSDVIGAGDWAKVETDQISTSHIEDVRITREPTGLEYFYVARWDGIYGYEIPPSGGTWVKLQGVEDLMAAAGVSIVTYDDVQKVTDLAFSENIPGWGYAFWKAYHAGPLFLGQDAVWGVAFTRNGWQSISWSVAIDTIVLAAGQTQRFADGQVALIQEEDGQIAFAASGKRDDNAAIAETKLYRTLDYGQSWAIVHTTPNYFDNLNTVVPHASQGYVYWEDGEKTYRSTQQGASGSFAEICTESGELSVSPVDPRYAIIMDGMQLYEHTPGTGISAYGPVWPGGVFGSPLAFIVTERNEDNTVHAVMQIGGDTAPLIRMVYDDGSTTTETGSWLPTSFVTGAVARPEAEEYLVYP